MCQRLLVIDDEEAILFAMREYFHTLGREVDCARSLDEAKRLLQPGRYSVAIADLRLTGSRGTEGLEVAEWVRANAPGTRVVILTAFGSPNVEAEARRIGVNAFLHKPRPLGEVARIVSEIEAGSPV